MINLILMVLTIGVFIVMGHYLEVNHLIVKPAYWAFYGSVYGMVLMALLVTTW